ncbi:MAG: ABC transporter permease [Betaproteobacteria bacterium]
MSPIHDQGYRRYGGGRAPRGRGWAVIAGAGIRTMLAKRTFIGLLLLSWMPFVVRAVQIYAAANFPQASILAPTASTFREFLDQQSIFVFFVTVYVGAGLIANDRRANALQIYLSRPLTRAEYVFGKLTVLAAFLLLVTWVPAVALLVVQILFAGNFTFFAGNLYLFPAITVFSLVEAVMIGSAMLALSSLSNSARYVGILYAGLIFFTQAIYGVLTLVTGSSRVSWLSLPADLAQVGNAIFRLPPRYDTPVAVSFLMVVLLVVVSALVLERRVRGVEVVS